MQAGFARVDLSPPVGYPLMGWGVPAERSCSAVHDPLYARALVIREGTATAVIVALDLCFIGRDDTARIHGLLGRAYGLEPRQVLLNASHTHAGPAVGNYNELEWWLAPRGYQRQVDRGIVTAVGAALAALQPATLWAGQGRTTLPLNRRQLRESGIFNAPNPAGPVYDALPVVLLRDAAEQPLALLFAASTHPVCFSGSAVSADFPGAACAALDAALGRPCSLFVQGMGGDSRPCTLAAGRDWRRDPGEAETTATGQLLASEVQALLPQLRPVKPRVQSALLETAWPLVPLTAAQYAAEAAADPRRRRWAEECQAQLAAGTLPASCNLLLQGLQLGDGLRLAALEGEPCHGYGPLLEAGWDSGQTVALGYTGGEGMYVVTTPMLAAGGYEPLSYWEYHQPGPLAPGMEATLVSGLAELRRRGVG
ncbi:MAG: neutral/alkaline non-lysosomal ceramidase N-terminal domain-containing protein [Fimbriimonadaceae bacterium]|nr:neutral/alkaline non-lysosomal ceramidase N-terminal domain-containing protein [Fimbriimonadaceae bacterium]